VGAGNNLLKEAVNTEQVFILKERVLNPLFLF
jgi:hypothetical protein